MSIASCNYLARDVKSIYINASRLFPLCPITILPVTILTLISVKLTSMLGFAPASVSDNSGQRARVSTTENPAPKANRENKKSMAIVETPNAIS